MSQLSPATLPGQTAKDLKSGKERGSRARVGGWLYVTCLSLKFITVWRDHVRQTFALPNRGSLFSGPIGSADYDFWKVNFGNHAGGGASLVAGVPEPTSIALLAVGLLSLLSFRSDRAR